MGNFFPWHNLFCIMLTSKFLMWPSNVLISLNKSSRKKRNVGRRAALLLNAFDLKKLQKLEISAFISVLWKCEREKVWQKNWTSYTYFCYLLEEKQHRKPLILMKNLITCFIYVWRIGVIVIIINEYILWSSCQ